MFKTGVFLVMLLISQIGLAQDPARFADELRPVINETEKEVEALSGSTLFTGSSSIRMWTDISDYFPDMSIVNRGFGGSEMSDLIHYHKDVILKYSPKKVFIYEGDNDIANGESPEAVIIEARQLLSKIRATLPEVPIVFISAKPSISRWHLKEQYLEYNRMLRQLCSEGYKLQYADTWDVMLDKQGNLQKELFIEDGLHMNAAGYKLWAQVLGPYLDGGS